MTLSFPSQSHNVFETNDAVNDKAISDVGISPPL